MKLKYNFVLIDDVPMNNLVTKLVIKSVYADAQIIEFTDAHRGWDYVSQQPTISNQQTDTIIFLDIYMPELDGWAFLEKYSQLDEVLKSKYKLYILSSSISKDDLKKADNNKNITGYVIKPFTKETIRTLVADSVTMP